MVEATEASPVTAEKKVLILGAYGMLGHALQTVFPHAVFRGRDLDITDRERVTTSITTLKPSLVINAAAYTDVDGCEDNRDHALLVNGYALEHIATACASANATLVHYSTDYVFDGSKTEYVESDTPNPINAYGASKLLGEQLVQENMSTYRIIRTSWLFGPHGKNFVDTMLQLTDQQKVVKVVNDQFGKPTYTIDLAQKTPEIVSKEPGIYHITNEGVCSWYQLAEAIIPNVIPCTIDQFPRKAKRPKYSVLINTKTSLLRHWRNALADYLRSKTREEYP